MTRVPQQGPQQDDILKPIKDVLTEITIWRGTNWNHAAADVCGEIERKLIAALRKVRAALSASRIDPAVPSLVARPPIGRAYIEVKEELNRLAASAASAAADKDPR